MIQNLELEVIATPKNGLEKYIYLQNDSTFDFDTNTIKYLRRVTG